MNISNYLYNEVLWCTMTPGNYYENYAAYMCMKADGTLFDNFAPSSTDTKVRPSISLSPISFNLLRTSVMSVSRSRPSSVSETCK